MQRTPLSCLLAALAASTAHAAPPTVPPDVRGAVQRRVSYGYTPGMTIGMVNADGRTVWSHGSRSWTDPTQPDGSTLYEIASVTKTFTAVLLAQMQQTGDLAFDDLVSTYLPPGTGMPSNGGNTITLYPKASHRFSYLDAGGSAEFTFSSDGTKLTVQQGRNIRFNPATAPPRLKINRDCDDIVLRLLGEPAQSYTLQTSADGRSWTDLAPWSLRHPPHREPATASSRLFRAIPTPP